MINQSIKNLNRAADFDLKIQKFRENLLDIQSYVENLIFALNLYIQEIDNNVIESNELITDANVQLSEAKKYQGKASVLKIAGIFYSISAAILGILFFVVAFQVMINSNKHNARRLMMASIIYLPLLFLIIIIERIFS